MECIKRQEDRSDWASIPCIGGAGGLVYCELCAFFYTEHAWQSAQSMGLETVGPEFYWYRSQTCRIGMWYSFVPCSLQNRSEPGGESWLDRCSGSRLQVDRCTLPSRFNPPGPSHHRVSPLARSTNQGSSPHDPRLGWTLSYLCHQGRKNTKGSTHRRDKDHIR